MIKVRLSGDEHEVEDAVLALQSLDGWRVVNTSEPYANRRDDGVRLYLEIEQVDDIVAAARRAAQLAVGTRVQVAGSFGVRWGVIVGGAGDYAYRVLLDEGRVVDVDHGHVVSVDEEK